jgi:hypothetical protein
MAFYEGTELDGDPTNWWGPNVPALQAMLRSVGFVEVLVVTPQRSTAYRALRALHHRLQARNALGPACRQDRAVCHAFR